MAQHVGHIFQCRAIANHLARRRMAEAVAPQAPPVQSNALEQRRVIQVVAAALVSG